MTFRTEIYDTKEQLRYDEKSSLYLRISKDPRCSRSSRRSSEGLPLWSKLALIELDELRRLCRLVSSGSTGVNPALFAMTFRTSVRETSPVSLPLSLPPVSAPRAAAEGGVGKGWAAIEGDEDKRGGTIAVGVMVGVGGVLEAGLGVSTTHILTSQSVVEASEKNRGTHLCACVATIFATVCANEDCGFTWKTGYESLPSFSPLSANITDRK
jgi:hypothetical protein